MVCFCAGARRDQQITRTNPREATSTHQILQLNTGLVISHKMFVESGTLSVIANNYDDDSHSLLCTM